MTMIQRMPTRSPFRTVWQPEVPVRHASKRSGGPEREFAFGLGERSGTPDRRSRLLTCDQLGLKPYVPFQAQFAPFRNETTTSAWNQVNLPVPPQNEQRPTASEQLPNALLLPGPGVSITTSLPAGVKSAAGWR